MVGLGAGTDFNGKLFIFISAYCSTSLFCSPAVAVESGRFVSRYVKVVFDTFDMLCS